MANYTIKFSCGHEGTIALFGKGTERERKIKFYEESGLCSDCYKTQKRAEEAATPLTLNCSVNALRVDEETGELLYKLSFSGNTMPAKDNIKSIGYRWTEDYPSDIKSLIMGGGKKVWLKDVKESDLKTEIEKAESIGAKINSAKLSNGIEILNYQSALELQKQWKKKQEQIAKITKPAVPEKIRGHRWNNKVYGKPGKYIVYLDNQEVVLTDEEASEIKTYVSEKETYQKKIAEIDK